MRQFSVNVNYSLTIKISKYNYALLVVENNNIGWATLQTIIDRGYKNLFYQSKDLQVVDVEHQVNNKYRTQDNLSLYISISESLKCI